MATGDGFTDGQISDPVAIGDFGFYYQTKSTTSSFTVEVEFSCKRYTEHWVKYRAKVTVNGNNYYSQEGIGLDPRVDTREGIPFTFEAVATGLPSGRAFVYTVQIQWYDLELSSDTWHDGGKAYKKIGATDGIPLPFNWQGTNYSRYHPDIEGDSGYSVTGEHYTGIDGKIYNALSYFNASADQTKKAYNAVKNGGRTSDFNTRVWNDLMDRIAWVQNEWGTKENKAINRVWPTPYISNLDPPYKKDIAIGDLVVKTSAGAAGRTITASVFNIAVGAIPIVNTWPWEKELGRKKIMPNDICRGSYFLALVDTLNHWISLTPLFVVITNNIATHNMSGKMMQLPSVPLEESGSFSLSYKFVPDSIPAVQGAHTARIGKLVDVFEVTVENGVLPFSSQFNFWDFNSSCKAAAVTAYVIGAFNGSVKQPGQSISLEFADTTTLQSSGKISAPKHTAELTAPAGCVIGEHGYTLRMAAQFQIGSAVSLYLEHNGIFGVVNSFTITPRDNDQSILDGTIGISSDIDEMLTEPGAAMEHLRQLTMTDSFAVSTSTGNIMGQDSQIRISGTSDFTVSNIVPLEFSGSTGFSATVDNIRMGKIYEIVDGSANVAIKPTSGVSVINTIDLGSTNTRVGFSAAAENNTNNPVELTGDATASIAPYKSTLNSQKDVIVSSSVRNAVKSDSEVDISKYRIVDGSANVAIKPTSGVGTTKPIKIESTEILITGKSTGEMVYKPFVAMPMGSAIIGNFTAAGIEAIDMTHARTTSVDAKILSGGSGDLTVSKGQKEIETQHIESIDTEAVMSFTAPAPLNGSETIRINVIGEADKSSGLALKNESETVLIRSEATVSKATVSLILASELEDTLVSDIEDTLAYDAERIVRTIDDDKSNTK